MRTAVGVEHQLQSEAVEANGGELKVNDTGARVPLLPAERQLVEASRPVSKKQEAAHNERKKWTKKKDLGLLMSNVDGVSGFKRSREQVADAVKTHVKKCPRRCDLGSQLGTALGRGGEPAGGRGGGGGTVNGGATGLRSELR